jgi:hypothetical protein
MVTTIGIMVGWYIIVRMVLVLSETNEDKRYAKFGWVIAQVLGLITILVTAFGLITMCTSAT